MAPSLVLVQPSSPCGDQRQLCGYPFHQRQKRPKKDSVEERDITPKTESHVSPIGAVALAQRLGQLSVISCFLGHSIGDIVERGLSSHLPFLLFSFLGRSRFETREQHRSRLPRSSPDVPRTCPDASSQEQCSPHSRHCMSQRFFSANVPLLSAGLAAICGAPWLVLPS
jgi:hypothetical protein